MFDIAILGRTAWDDWVIPNQNLRSDNLDFFGGPGANVAAHLANLEFRCTLVTVLGSDRRSRIYEEYLTSLGVDLSFAARSSGPLARCRITPGKTYTWINGKPEFPETDPEQIQEILACSRAIFWSEGVVSLEASMLPELAYWSPQLALSLRMEHCRSLAQYNWRAVFLNAKEAALFAHETGKTISRLSVSNRATKWIITNEQSPTLIIQNGISTYYKVPKANPKISVGGGDAFAAGYCAADMRNWGEAAAVELGHALAKAVVSQVGCQLSVNTARKIATDFRRRKATSLASSNEVADNGA